MAPIIARRHLVAEHAFEEISTRERLRDLLIAAFGAALLSAQRIDPEIELTLGG
jgi:hypothetical protein